MESKTEPAKTAEEIAEKILYYPVTNNQSEASISKGAELIKDYARELIKQVLQDAAERATAKYGWISTGIGSAKQAPIVDKESITNINIETYLTK